MGQYKRKLKKGWRWFYSGQYLGQKYHSKAIYLNKTECAKAEREKLKELDEQARSPQQDMKLKTLMDNRLDEIELNKSKDYYRENRRYFKKALKKWGKDIMVSGVTKPMVNDLLIKEARRLKRAKKTNYKVNAMLRALKALFNYGNRIYDLNHNPCNLDFYPIDVRLKYIPPDEDIEAVKAKCNDMQKLFIEFVDETGARVMEAVRLKYSDIDGDLITLWTRKSRNSNLMPRRIPKPSCIDSLPKKKKGKVFPYSVLPRFLERKVEKLGQKTWSWHSLRHRRASIWATEGMSVFEIMHRLGHNNMSTTMKYLQLLGFSGGKNDYQN